MITEEIFIAMIFLDAAFTLWFFLDISKYFSNIASAALCYFVSTGLSSAMASGIDSAGVVTTDPWLASILAWHSYAMLLLGGLALLKNTVLSNERVSWEDRPGRNLTCDNGLLRGDLYHRRR